MAEIVATFDTKEKVLTVTMDGKKMKDVSEAVFYTWGENGSVELRTVKSDQDESYVTVTKIMASEDGDHITETTECDAEERQTEDLSRALLPKKYRDGV